VLLLLASEVTLESYDITQQDWDIIRKHGLVDNDGMSIIEPNTLARMKDDDVRMDFGVGSDKEVRVSVVLRKPFDRTFD
jgi:hypothetical protein